MVVASNLQHRLNRPYQVGHSAEQALFVLDNLGKQYPAVAQRLFENGQLRRFVNIYLNDEDIRYLDNLTTAVKDGDDVSIIPAVAGG